MYRIFWLFFQAEDGIRDVAVTGVQTCALPIFDPSTSSKLIIFFSSRRRHTRLQGDWSSDVCSSDLGSRRVRPGEKGDRPAWLRPTDGICRCVDHSLWPSGGTPPARSERHRGRKNRSASGPKPGNAFRWITEPDNVGNAGQKLSAKLSKSWKTHRVDWEAQPVLQRTEKCCAPTR